MYVKSVIGEEYKKWALGSEVYLKAETGTGKSTFILEKLLPYAIEQDREILYLTNRKILHKQLISDICKLQGIPYSVIRDEHSVEFMGITFMTYQSLQERLKNGQRFDEVYYYIVADEVHYIIEDSMFNPKIRLLLEWLNNKKRSVFIAISATIEDATNFLGFYKNEWTLCEESKGKCLYERKPQNCCNAIFGIREYLYIYTLEAEKNNVKVFAYDDIEQIIDQINSDKSNEKWLIFQANIKEAKNIEKKLKCTKKFVSAEAKDKDVIEEIISTKNFSYKVLICTKVLDNGISLKDIHIKNVVIEATSRTEFLQMYGRRRKCNNDKDCLNLFIPIKTQQYFQTYCVKKLYPELRVINAYPEKLLNELLESLEIYEICKKYYMLENGRLLLNPVAKWVLNERIKFFEKMSQKMKEDPYAFIKMQLKWLDNPVEFSEITFMRDVQNSKARKMLKKILEDNQDKILMKGEQDLLKEKLMPFLQLLVPNRFPHKSRKPGLHIINECLETLDMNFKVVSKSGKRKGQVTVWKIQKI